MSACFCGKTPANNVIKIETMHQTFTVLIFVCDKHAWKANRLLTEMVEMEEKNTCPIK